VPPVNEFPQQLRPESLIQTACEAVEVRKYSKKKVYQGAPPSAMVQALWGVLEK
jgi:hypothetical protein